MEKQTYNEIEEQIESDDEQIEQEQDEECVDCENCQKAESMVKVDDRNLCFVCVTAMNIQDMKKKPKVGFPTLKKKTVDCEYCQKPSTMNVGPNICDECYESMKEMFRSKSTVYDFPTTK